MILGLRGNDSVLYRGRACACETIVFAKGWMFEMIFMFAVGIN